jgi:hypothetical protein
MRKSRSRSTTTTGQYCPAIADCEAPYKCIEGFCRIQCRHDNICPNRWRCGADGFCLDDNFLRRQRRAARNLTQGRPKKVVQQPAILRESRADDMDTWAKCFIGGSLLISLAVFGVLFWRRRKAEGKM